MKILFIPVTLRLKAYTRFVEKYVTGRRKISETVRARLLGFSMQIPELLAQRKFVLARCHTHSYAHKPPKSAAPTVLMLEYKP